MIAIAHYNDVIMGAMASQITSLTIVYSTVYSSEDQRKNQSSASLAFVRGIPRWPVKSPHKWPVTRKMFPFDDVIMVMMFIHCSVDQHDIVFIFSFGTSQNALEQQLRSRIHYKNITKQSKTKHLGTAIKMHHTADNVTQMVDVLWYASINIQSFFLTPLTAGWC